MSSFYGNGGVASGGGGGGTFNYNELLNKPQINGVTLTGDINSEDLGIRDGIDGADGKDGIDGKDGANGKSAYEYAVDAGYTGTKEEFSQKLARANDCDCINILRTVGGNPIVLNDSADASFEDFKVFGKSMQNKVAGNQLFNILNCTKSGVLTYNDGIISGRSWGTNIDVDGDALLKYLKPNTTYYGKCTMLMNEKVSEGEYNKSKGLLLHRSGVEGLENYSEYLFYTNANLENGKSIQVENSITTPDDLTGMTLRLYTEYFDNSGVVQFSDVTFSDLIISEQDVPYEPYVGGKPSPNMDYPQEIVNAGQELAASKNLIPFPYYEMSVTRRGVTFTADNNGVVHAVGTAETDTWIILNNKDYGLTDYRAQDCFYNSGNKYTSINIAAGETVDKYFYPMINEGTTILPWEKPLGDKKYVKDKDINIQVSGKNLFSGLIKGIGINSSTGKETTNALYSSTDYIEVNKEKSYYLSGLSNTLYSFIFAYDKNKNALARTSSTVRTDILLKISPTLFSNSVLGDINNIKYIRITQYENAGASGTIDDIDNLQIQLEIGTQATEYELYKEPQILPISVTGGLPGIPVSSNGDYIDENGQQWICNYRDYERGVDVCKVWKYIFTGNEIVFDDYIENSDTIILKFPDETPIGAGNQRYDNSVMCNYASKRNINFSNSSGTTIGFSNNSSFWKFENGEQLKQWLSERYEAGSPLIIQYILAEPIETSIPAEELAAYYLSHTNYHNTVISNNENADMNVKYIADTKTYIDQNYVLKEEYNNLEQRVILLEQKVNVSDKVITF